MFFAIICIILSMAFQDSFLGMILFAVGMFSLVSSVAGAVNKMEESKTNANHENLSEKNMPSSQVGARCAEFFAMLDL